MRHLALLIALCPFPACSLGLDRDPPETARYLIEARRDGPAGDPAELRLEVRNFHAQSPFAATRFVYRTGEERYETDFYREFLVAPERMLADQTRGWLAAAGLARVVLGPGARTAPTHALEADLVGLYADYRRPEAAEAVVELRVFVTRIPDEVLAQHVYREVEALDGADPDRFAAAAGRAVARILARLEADLRGLLGADGG
jgi:hypothetical protein